MKKQLATAALFAMAALPVLAADGYTVDPNHTYPSFEVNHLGFSVQRGRFNQTGGKITLDLEKKSGTADITIDAASLSTGLPKLEAHLKNEDFFDVTKYPVITFSSKNFNFHGDRLASVDGEFTLHGVTRPLTLTVTGFHCGINPLTKKQHCGADAHATIRRSEFGMSTYVPAVSDEVKLLINVEAIKD